MDTPKDTVLDLFLYAQLAIAVANARDKGCTIPELRVGVERAAARVIKIMEKAGAELDAKAAAVGAELLRGR